MTPFSMNNLVRALLKEIVNSIHHGIFGLYFHGGGRGAQSTPFKISKTKNDLSMNLSSQNHVYFAPIVCLFTTFGLWYVMWLWHDFYEDFLQIMQFIHIIAPDYQKSFGIFYIGAIYVFLVLLVIPCCTWNKKTEKNQ